MLDKFLEVAYTRTKEAESKERLVGLMMKLPNDVLKKVASGEIALKSEDGGEKTWLERFRGTPLFDQAIQLEQQELELRMQDEQRRMDERSTWDQRDHARAEIDIQRKILELELAKGGPMEEPGAAPMEMPVEEAPVEEPPVMEEEAPSAPAVPPVKVDVKAPSPPKKEDKKEEPPKEEEPAPKEAAQADPRQLTGGEGVAAAALGNVPGYLGAKKAVESGEGTPLEGGVRGVLGAGAGAGAGGMAGTALTQALANRVFMQPTTRAALVGAGGLAGAGLGELGGYKALTHKFKKDTEGMPPEMKEAALKMKVAYMSCDENWLGSFKGTPLFEQAAALEEQAIQQEMDELDQRNATRGQSDQYWQARDQLNVQKRMLMLELLKSEGGMGGGGGEELIAPPPEAMEAPVEEAPAEAAPPPPKEEKKAPPPPKEEGEEEEVDEKEASIRFRRAVIKMAQSEKDANVGMAMLSGLKGAGTFLGGAGKSVMQAAKGGGMAAAMPALRTAGQTGLQQATQFAKANPMAAAGLGAGAAGLGGMALGRATS